MGQYLPISFRPSRSALEEPTESKTPVHSAIPRGATGSEFGPVARAGILFEQLLYDAADVPSRETLFFSHSQYASIITPSKAMAYTDRITP